MAAITKNRNFFKGPKLLYFKPERAQIWTVSIMMSFLAYITGFFMNFELFPTLTNYANKKKGGMKLKKSSSLKLLSQSQPNFAEMILRWSPFKILSVSAVLYPRWPPLLKIEISSNGQNCTILSQKVPKFELHKHNDELFNIYYRIVFMNFELLPILTDYAN